MKWDINDFFNINLIRLPSSKVWLPDTFIYNSANYKTGVDGHFVLVILKEHIIS